MVGPEVRHRHGERPVRGPEPTSRASHHLDSTVSPAGTVYLFGFKVNTTFVSPVVAVPAGPTGDARAHDAGLDDTGGWRHPGSRPQPTHQFGEVATNVQVGRSPGGPPMRVVLFSSSSVRPPPSPAHGRRKRVAELPTGSGLSAARYGGLPPAEGDRLGRVRRQPQRSRGERRPRRGGEHGGRRCRGRAGLAHGQHLGGRGGVIEHHRVQERQRRRRLSGDVGRLGLGPSVAVVVEDEAATGCGPWARAGCR